MAKVAVITRTKDRPIFLRRAIDSVHHQSFNDFEHVIVNDGGDPAEVESIIKNLDTEHKGKIKVINRPSASNAPDTILTESVDHSTAEYVVIHDDDDTWHQDFLQETVKYLEENKSIGGVVVKTDKVIEELQSDGNIKRLRTMPWLADVKAISIYRQCAENQLTPISFLFRRSAYKEAGRYDNTLPVCGDWDFGIRFLQKYDVDILDPGYPLAFYHHRKYVPGKQGNTSFAGNEKHRYYANYLMNKYLREELNTGKLGVGYIMSKIRYDQNYTARMIERVLPGFITKKLKNRAQQY